VGKWGVLPSVGHLAKAATAAGKRKADPVPSIYEQLAAIAASPVLSSGSHMGQPPSSDSEEGERSQADSSGWESESSGEVEIVAIHTEADTGAASFATL
jgi:hypothetical protein